jgi:hypothetical protein
MDPWLSSAWAVWPQPWASPWGAHPSCPVPSCQLAAALLPWQSFSMSVGAAPPSSQQSHFWEAQGRGASPEASLHHGGPRQGLDPVEGGKAQGQESAEEG